MTRVTMYSRGTCGLCDEARDAVLDVRAQWPFEFEEILIDGNPLLERAYGSRVPVVLVDGHERFELWVEPDALRDLVAGPEGA
jgi:glutaredoxin